MIAIVCRSAYLSSTLAGMLSGVRAVRYAPEGTGNDMRNWLTDTLKGNRISVVFYEPAFFIDPAPYRSMSPSTRFVVLASPGEESAGNDALAFGAAAMLAKPVEKNAVSGVFQLVSV